MNMIEKTRNFVSYVRHNLIGDQSPQISSSERREVVPVWYSSETTQPNPRPTGELISFLRVKDPVHTPSTLTLSVCACAWI